MANLQEQTLSVEQLYAMRRQIDNLLPQNSLKNLDIEKELVIQLAVVKQLQRDTIDDENTPANQRAQVAGQVASALATLAKLQIDVFDSERLKKIEAILVNCINKLPKEAQEEFLAEYERQL